MTCDGTVNRMGWGGGHEWIFVVTFTCKRRSNKYRCESWFLDAVHIWLWVGLHHIVGCFVADRAVHQRLSGHKHTNKYEMCPLYLAYGWMLLSYPVVPEGTRLRVRLYCSFGAPGWLQVKMVVEVTHTETRLWQSRQSLEMWLKSQWKNRANELK